MTETKVYACPVKGETVTLVRQLLSGLSGIGDTAAYQQIDYDCSRGCDCAYRMQPTCKVYRLNGSGE